MLLTAGIYSNCLKNGFINWDDPTYILENPLIRDLSFVGIRQIFTTLHFNGFLPITQLSLGLDYFFWKENPAGYHLTNLILHLVNIVVVFFLTASLSGKKNAALITCLLFAIHPMRVESIAWASERKDVLYAFFYLLSLLAYVSYIKNNFKIGYVIFSWVLFSLSAFSKWSAYPLPFLLLVFDYYLGRKIGKRVLLEKLLFLVIPAVSIFIHLSIGTVVKERFPFFDRVLLGGYSLFFYLIKFIFPFDLSAIYPYPTMINGLLPLEYYFAPAGILTITVFVYLLAKKFPSEGRFLFFCLAFFLINLGMVLHILAPIGGVVVAADRYTYIAYLGLFIIAGKYSENFYNYYLGNVPIKSLLLIVFLGIMLLFSVKTFQRIKIWKNSLVFFNEIIQKDSTIAFAWNNLGSAKADVGKQHEAIDHYTKAIHLNPEFSFAYNNRGLAYDATGNFEPAILDFNRALKIKNNEDPTVYFNRGLTYFHWGNYPKALEDMTSAIKINPREIKYYIKRGALSIDMGSYANAKEDFITAIKLSPENAEAFNYLGLSYNYLNMKEESLRSYDRAIILSPGYSSAYNNRGWVKFLMKKYDTSMQDFSKSIELDPAFSFPYHNRGLLFYELNYKEKACNDWENATRLGYGNSQKLIDLYCK